MVAYHLYEIITNVRKLIKLRAKLACLNHCAVLFLSHAAVNWYCYTYYCYERTQNRAKESDVGKLIIILIAPA